jgi:signal transduction histidine kinase
MSDLLLKTDLTPEQSEFARTVSRSAELLLTILNDILDFSKIEAGKLSLVEEDFDLRQVIEDTLELLAENPMPRDLNWRGFSRPRHLLTFAATPDGFARCLQIWLAMPSSSPKAVRSSSRSPKNAGIQST